MNVMVALVCVAFVTSKSGNEASRGRSLSAPLLGRNLRRDDGVDADMLFIGLFE